MVRLTQTLFRLLPLSVLLLAACAGAPPGKRAPVIDASQPARTDPGRAPGPAAVDTVPEATDVVVIPLERSTPGASPAVASLLGQAEAASRGRDWAAAAASLERGLRIEPRNPVLWNRLAEVRLQQGQYRQAEQLAAKSTSLAGDDRLLQMRNWRLIARARRHQGDEHGAAEAERQADFLR